MRRILIILLCSLLACVTLSHAQTKEDEVKKSKLSFRDSLDGAIDLSDWIIHYNGFIPAPMIITEPAVGGFGGALATIFIKQQHPRVVDGKIYPVAPNITAAFGGYTVNNSWAIGLGRTASIAKWGLKYKIGGAYANINIDYYFDVPKIGEKSFDFNIRTIPVFAYLGKELKDPRWTVGLEYMFAHSKLKLNTGDTGLLDSIVSSKEMNSNVGHIGLRSQFDGRDNVFTPNKGLETYLDIMWSDNIWGSDYSYWQMEGALYWYIPVMQRWISGTRFDMQQVFNDPPFYLKPFIDMRGLPAARYQGKTTMLLETEQRIDVYKRWSVMAFGGLGKAFDSYSDFGSSQFVYSYGTGFRYLIARKLKLRMGVDIAKGTDSWGYYIVFGSNWLRQ